MFLRLLNFFLRENKVFNLKEKQQSFLAKLFIEFSSSFTLNL